MILLASGCRVSTDKDDQANSFEAQQQYFKSYIDRQPEIVHSAVHCGAAEALFPCAPIDGYNLPL